MIKAVIFDMDGVLIDSVQVGLKVRKQLLAGYGVDMDAVPDPRGEGHRAASLKTLLASVHDHHGLQIDHDEFAKLSVKSMHHELQKSGASADPNLIALLKELVEHGIVCAVTSASLRESVNNKLSILGISDYFTVIVTGSDVAEHKPHPEAYIVTIEKLGLKPNECIIFEDTKTGIEAGIGAGCQVIGFTQYNQPTEPFNNVRATVVNWGDITYDKLMALG